MSSNHQPLTAARAPIGALATVGLLLYLSTTAVRPATAAEISGMNDARKAVQAELIERHGEAVAERLARGLDQVSRYWRLEDGDAQVFAAFVRRHFAADDASRDALFTRTEEQLEALHGHLNDISVSLRMQSDLDRGPIRPFDEIFGAYDPGAHVLDDLFANKLAFVILLNFPLTTLDQRLAEGEEWSRRQWAEARLAQQFSRRMPADVSAAMSAAIARANQYIAGYNIWMHHLVDDTGGRLFPTGMRLLSHWNLRDEIKAQYAVEDGLALERQRTVERVMERIVKQTIPAAVIDSPHVDWNPFTNAVTRSSVVDGDTPAPDDLAPTARREPDTRYETLLGVFHAAREVDAYAPTAPTLIKRRFDEDRELPESRVRAMFDTLFRSSQFAATAQLIQERLGRRLEPFDIWYNGFRPRGAHSSEELDAITRERYPDSEAFHADVPRILVELGFDAKQAQQIALNIVVEPARGSGHAWGAERRGAKTRLRTRVGAAGMDYKGYNIAVHELGHNVEQTLSLNDIDHTLLHGVPNTAFTEALAFVFQERDMELLGLHAEDAATEALRTLDTFWNTVEIAGVALVDMAVWQWMYDHPEATPSELRAATIAIAREVWNERFAPAFGKKDSVLLGVYSHMIQSVLYLPDYPIGHLIAFQIGKQMKKAGTIGPEFARMVAAGNIAPDLWMKQATGAPVGPDALLTATADALLTLKPAHHSVAP